MKKSFLIANIVVISAFFLVFLGMRNLSLDQNGGPKPRPRAVIENVEKAKAQFFVSFEQQVDAEPCAPVVLAAVSESRTIYRPEMAAPPTLTRQFLPSRASPTLPSRFV